MPNWKGCVIEESLEDNRVLNKIEIIKVRITTDDTPQERWHIYNVSVSEKEIDFLHNKLKQAWYMHFWQDNKMLVLFKDRKFTINPEDKKTWKAAIEYGLSLGIPKEQLVFEKEF